MEKLCLKWNDFQINVNSAFGKLRNDQDLSDVTLVCEDGKQLEAHKVVLAASSPFFLELLQRNKHQHPLVFMRGVKSDNLSSLVDFLYYGEVNVLQESLDAFLALAEDLKLKGLTGSEENSNNETEVETPKHNQTRDILLQNKIKSDQIRQRNTQGMTEPSFERAIATFTPASNDPELHQLDDQIKSMMEPGTKGNVCKVCGKEGQSIDIKRHIEVNHITGVTHPCDFVERTPGQGMD